MTLDGEGRDRYQLQRIETDVTELRKQHQQDVADLRNEVRGVQRELSVGNSQTSAQVLGLQASLPLTYVTRQDLAERFANERATIDGRISGIEKAVNEMQTTARQLIFAIIAALVSGGLALLAEVFRLISGVH